MLKIEIEGSVLSIYSKPDPVYALAMISWNPHPIIASFADKSSVVY